MDHSEISPDFPVVYGSLFYLHGTHHRHSLDRLLLDREAKYDVPALYDPKGIYYYQVSKQNPQRKHHTNDIQYGCNWRALVVLLIIIVPLLPPMAHVVNPSSISVPAGFTHLYDFNWLYGFISGSTLYYVLNRIFPYKRGLIPTAVLVESSIYGTSAIEGVATQQSHTDVENKASDSYGDRKIQSEVAKAFAGVTPRPEEG
jgi:NCS1 family nucleobase:cation symporter-1